MRVFRLVALGLGVLVLEGALTAFLNIQLLQPGLVMAFVVFLAFRGGEAAGLAAFALGLCMDAFAVTPTGLLTSASMLAFVLVRLSLIVVIPHGLQVRLCIMFGASLAAKLWAVALLVSHLPGSGAFGGLGPWLPVAAILETAFAPPLWALSRRILGPEPSAVRPAWS